MKSVESITENLVDQEDFNKTLTIKTEEIQVLADRVRSDRVRDNIINYNHELFKVSLQVMLTTHTV